MKKTLKEHAKGIVTEYGAGWGNVKKLDSVKPRPPVHILAIFR